MSQMPFRTASDVAQIRETGTAKGLGVFAVVAINEGQIVEISPVVVLGGDFDELAEPLQHRVFAWSALTGEEETAHAIALGWGGCSTTATLQTLNTLQTLPYRG